MDWQECKNKKFVKGTSEDVNLVGSLVKSSDKIAESNNRLNLDGTTASTKVGLAYDSLREVLEALAIREGYKIYNHECFGSFLKEICHDETSANDFDRFRRIRNQIKYYGKDVSPEEAKIIIAGIIELRNLILKEFSNLEK